MDKKLYKNKITVEGIAPGAVWELFGNCLRLVDDNKVCVFFDGEAPPEHIFKKL